MADACFARDAIGLRCVRKATEERPVPQETRRPASSATGLAYDPVYLKHRTGLGHPERPERLRAIIRRLEETGLADHLVRIPAQPAPLEWVHRVHAPQYVERVRSSCQSGIGWVDSPDAPASSDSYEVALMAVGGVLAAVDAVVEGRVRNAFCAVRPPGHHALPNHAMGFCLLNNVAIAARYAQERHSLRRVLIVDWDVHHGNGTQEVFYRDPAVFYFSVHQHPFYPGTGSQSERGAGEGLGYTLNVPLPSGSGDEAYQRVFEEIFEPAARRFDPDFVLISAGFDAHQDDLLGGMVVSTEQFAWMTRSVKGIAETCCRGRLVSVLEGGYELTGLAHAVEAHLRVLAEPMDGPPRQPP
ncbi:MAG TPA: histone deacetylase [Planctomycetes bacterium]|nr:histone deacetylase [Planctomycetota bacterium]